MRTIVLNFIKKKKTLWRCLMRNIQLLYFKLNTSNMDFRFDFSRSILFSIPGKIPVFDLNT